MPKSSLPQRIARRTVQSWRSRNCYEDQVKRRIALTGIGRQSRQQEASGRDNWRSSARKAGRKLEAERHEAAKERRRRQKVQWGCAHQNPDSAASNERARTVVNLPKSLSERNQPSDVSSPYPSPQNGHHHRLHSHPLPFFV